MELVVQKREVLGKGVRVLREGGVIPAELYGHGIANAHLSVSQKEFRKVFKEAGENTVISLVVDGAVHPALVHDIQRNALDGDILHVDFHEVRMDEKISAAIPFDFEGEPPAIKEYGGILLKSLHELEIEALPADLPHSIVVDLSGLDAIGKSIHVRDIAISDKVKVLVEEETVIATITAPQKEEEVAPAEEMTVEDVKVEGEEERAARQAEEESKPKEVAAS